MSEEFLEPFTPVPAEYIHAVDRKVARILAKSGTLSGPHRSRRRVKLEDAEYQASDGGRSPVAGIDLRHMSVEQILSMMKDPEYNQWKLNVYRTGPEQYRGTYLRLGKVNELSGLVSDVESVITSWHGGGEYKLQIVDSSGKVKKTQTLLIDPGIRPEVTDLSQWERRIPDPGISPPRRPETIVDHALEKARAGYAAEKRTAHKEAFTGAPTLASMRRLVQALVIDGDTLSGQVTELARQNRKLQDRLDRYMRKGC